MRSRFLALLLIAATCATANAASLTDGPYVSFEEGRAWIARWVEGEAKVREEKTQAGATIDVPAVGKWPAIRVTLRVPGKPDPDEVALKKNVPLFVMADTHGEFEIAAELLQRQRVIDSKLRWSFGRGHLVVLGDVFDRGPNQTELLWLLYQLEAEATRAGGGVHFVLGNHETMALGGDERYLHPKYLQVSQTLKSPDYAALWSESTLLGKWLRTKATVLKIGGYLCLHGGISRELVDRGFTLAQINADVRAALGQRKPEGFVFGPSGPQWYRGYFPEAARQGGFALATSDDIAAILSFYEARSVFVGHTIVPTVTPLFEGRVVAVQVYPHQDDNTKQPVMEGLLVKGGRFHRAKIDGQVELLSR